MSGKIQLLDCTLRDGAYIVEGKFGDIAKRGIIDNLLHAGVEIIECGWLKNDPYKEGYTYYHTPQDLEHVLPDKKGKTLYTVMIDWDRYDLDFLPTCDGKSLDAIRVVFPHGKAKEGTAVGEKIKAKGYKVFFQAANTLAYSDEDLLELATLVNAVNPVSLSVVDTFGAMYEEDLERIVNVLDGILNPEIKLGFHSHNNQQLSFALTIHFIKLFAGRNRSIIVDSSLCGMGRGAGNATTELVVSYLNRKCNGNYDLDEIMEAIDTYMPLFQENYEWGYSTPYFIAGLYCCHVNNIAYLLKNHRTNAKDMRNIIESLSPADRKKYDYDLLENKYIENQNRIVEDREAMEFLKRELQGRNILLIAPGKSSVTDREKIEKYIKEKNALVIGVNAFVQGYSYDFLFLMNAIRYKYAREAYPEKFAGTRKILLSNIKVEGDSKEIVINFNRVIKRGWEHFDNAVINVLRLLERLEISHVAIAGFDGFKTHYNESYADESLPTLNPNGNWDELNSEIKDMYRDFRSTARSCKEIEFVTSSIFEE